MLLDLQQNKDKSLTISYFNKDGNVQFKRYDTSNIYNWQVCNESDRKKTDKYRNWDGRPVKGYNGKFLTKHAQTEFLENLPKDESEEVFGYNFPKVYFFDIETEVTEGFPKPEDANNMVQTISLVTPNNKVIVFGLKDLTKKEESDICEDINKRFEKFGANWEFKYKKFKSEYDLVYTFMKMVSKIPILSGWYCIDFDWKYLVNRCYKLNINPEISSPVSTLNDRNKVPIHVGIIDYKELYMNWDRSISPKENGKLETAGKQVLDMGKIEYNGELQELYNNDFKKYVFYNAVDSVLVHYIDKKLKTLQIILTLSNICKISIYKASSPVTITESILCRNLLKEGKVMAKDFDNTESNKKKGKFQGAFVKEPIVGRHRGVACFDFASLYPSIMRQFNISPDSYQENISNNIKDEKRKELLGKKIVTTSGALYDNKPSILKKVLTDLYDERKKYKKQSFEYQMLADNIKQKLKTM